MKYTDSQLRAILEEGKNIIVSAGAGSGKTGVLMARVIEKLKQGTHIDELVILTFTNAAAFEMKSRIVKAIKLDKNLTKELKRVNNAIITTFDAFCLRLVKEYHYLLDLANEIGIADKVMIMDMEKKVLETTIENYYLSNDNNFDDLVLSLYQRGDRIIYDTVSSLARKLMKEPDYNLILDEFVKRYYDKDFLETKFNEFEAYLLSLIDTVEEYYQSMISQIEQYLDNPKVEVFIKEVSITFEKVKAYTCFDDFIDILNQLVFPKKMSIKGDEIFKSILDTTYDPMRDGITNIKNIIADSYIDSKETAINNVISTKKNVAKIVDITKDYLSNLELQKRKLNRFNYSDIMNLAIRLLEDYPNIAESYRFNIKEIMVDEYQDTNDLQEYFISLIANNNLFMVGDMKQSIYGFRDANPENFLKKYQEYQNTDKGTSIDLRHNFRSRSEILEDINLCFYNIMNQEIGGINYQDNQSLIYGLTNYDKRCKDQKHGIELIKYDYKEIKANNPDIDKTNIELELLVKDIKSRFNNNFQIFDIKPNSFRNLRYSDIAILVDRATDFNRTTSYLSNHNIPVNLFSDEPFFESPEMLFLTNYLKFLKCFTDNDYLQMNFKSVFYSVARSFVFQIKDEFIINALLSIEVKQINALLALENIDEFRSLISISKSLSADIDSLPTYEFLKKTYREIELFSKLSFLDNPSKKQEKLDYFTQNIKGFTGFSFTDLIDYLELIESNRDWDIEYSKTNQNLEAINLMTMHKSKGLEFPIVYVIGLDKKFNFTENQDFFIMDKQYGLITNVIDDGYFPVFMRYLYLNEAKKKYISERIRLLYVTFTRAKENLVLIVNENSLKPTYDLIDDTNYVQKDVRLKFGKYTDLIASSKLMTYPAKTLEEIVDVKQDIISSQSNKVIEKKTFNFHKTEKDKYRYSKETYEILNDEVKLAINYGNEIHSLLEYVDFTDFENSTKNLPEKIKNNLLGLYEFNLIKLEDSPVFYQEMEFYNQDRETSGIIDLLVEYNDKIVIVDYKLKNIDDISYERQLQGYREYIAKKTNKEIQTYLFSILDKEIKQII